MSLTPAAEVWLSKTSETAMSTCVSARPSGRTRVVCVHGRSFVPHKVRLWCVCEKCGIQVRGRNAHARAPQDNTHVKSCPMVTVFELRTDVSHGFCCEEALFM